jgi:hypothetical protein
LTLPSNSNSSNSKTTKSSCGKAAVEEENKGQLKVFQMLVKRLIVPNNSRVQRRLISFTLIVANQILHHEEFKKLIETHLVKQQVLKNNQLVVVVEEEGDGVALLDSFIQHVSDFFLTGVDFALSLKQQLNKMKFTKQQQ